MSGKAFFCSNDHDAARSQYEQAKGLDYRALTPLEGIAEIEVAEGNFTEAIRTYTKLVGLASKHAALRIRSSDPANLQT